MRNIFDYTFYRTAKRHFKKDGANSFTANLTITFIIYLYLLFLHYSIVSIFGYEFLHKVSFLEKAIVLVIMIGIFLIVKKTYKNKYFIYRDRWIAETKSQKLIGEVLIILFFICPIILMYIVRKIN